jgi:3-hydroxyacyl-CoA dehydrogenase
LRTVLVHNAILLAIKEIAAPTVIDRAWITATGAQRGPFKILDELGAEQYAKHLATHRRDGWVNDDANAVDAYLQRCDRPHVDRDPLS